MDLEHTFVVPASIEQTWKAFNDLESIAPCFPGATLTSAEGDEFKGSVKVKLGPIAMQYNGTGSFLERDEAAHRAVIEAKGKDKRGNGTASATVTAQLTQDGDGTAVEVKTDLTVTGKPAQFGRGVIQDVSDKLLAQFVDCIAGTLGGGDAEPAAPEAASQPSAAPAPEAQPSAAPAPETQPSAPGPGAQPTTARQETASEPPPRPQAASGSQRASDQPASELNLMSTVLPVLARRYAAPVSAALGALVAFVLLRRRRKRRRIIRTE